jgi:hypothetical protein
MIIITDFYVIIIAYEYGFVNMKIGTITDFISKRLLLEVWFPA